MKITGGGGEIRTHDTLSDMTVFKTVAFNHSATPPYPHQPPGLAQQLPVFAPFWKLAVTSSE